MPIVTVPLVGVVAAVDAVVPTAPVAPAGALRGAQRQLSIRTRTWSSCCSEGRGTDAYHSGAASSISLSSLSPSLFYTVPPPVTCLILQSLFHSFFPVICAAFASVAAAALPAVAAAAYSVACAGVKEKSCSGTDAQG